MKRLRLSGFVDHKGMLHAQMPPQVRQGALQFAVLVPEDDADESELIRALAEDASSHEDVPSDPSETPQPRRRGRPKEAVRS
jgi:hypothetical protein